MSTSAPKGESCLWFEILGLQLATHLCLFVFHYAEEGADYRRCVSIPLGRRGETGRSIRQFGAS